MSHVIRALIVEDTSIAQVIARKHMEAQGCEVEVAADGASALEKALQTHYDVILMDIGLGDGPDGFEVARQIKSQSNPNMATLIAALTSHSSPEDIEQAMQAGMEKYYSKPFRSEDSKELVDYVKEKLNANGS